MRYADFEIIMAPPRIGRYLAACGGNSLKAMTLYRKNLKLSQELFTIISCFEVALRNAIDRHYTIIFGNNWLQAAAAVGGVFDNISTHFTRTNIIDAVRKLSRRYNHHKLVAELGFGFWRYMFAHHQFRLAGSSLLQIFPARPRTTPAVQYNHTYIFNQLQAINELRNRIAHHEPVCFQPGRAVKDTVYVRTQYDLILQLFQWMGIDESALLYGLDHISLICDQIDAL